MTSAVVSARTAGAGRLTQRQPQRAQQRAPASRGLSTAALSGSRAGLLTPGVPELRQDRQWGRVERQRTAPAAPRAKANDPDGVQVESSNKGPPNVLWRVFAATIYVIPWIDSLTLGREIFHSFPSSIVLYFLPAPFVSIYYVNTFMPLIIFFLCFLAIVKNTKISHFVRFNTMQAIMMDIVVMLFNILRAYFPAEFRWSILLVIFDKFSFLACMATVLYAVFFTLRGFYADIPFISEAVYIQVEASEYA